ncbi:LysR family transcriptional regulator [Bacillus sp. NP157]|nr:LysR family transcriptional regulator [Bacillus sp. NP157]
MDRLEAMRVLVEAVDRGSLSEAARRLGMPLPTVSRKVSELEEALGARLLVRSPRKLTLTDAGETYLAAARRILEDVDCAERMAAGEYAAPRGELVVTAPIVLGKMHLLPAVTAFLAAYPDIRIRLMLVDRWVNLVDEQVDVAIRVGALPDSALVARHLANTRLVSCASPDYLERRGTPTHPSELAQHECINFDGIMSPRQWVFAENRRDLVVPLVPRLTVTTAEAAIEAATAGMGITRVVAYQIVARMQAGTLVTVLDAYEPAPLPVHLLFPSSGRLPVKVRTFIDFVMPHLGEALK